MECLVTMDGVDAHVVLLHQHPLINVAMVLQLPVGDLLIFLSVEPANFTPNRQYEGLLNDSFM